MTMAFYLFALVSMKMLLPTEFGYQAGIALPEDRILYKQIHEETFNDGERSKQLVSLYVPDIVITYIRLEDLYNNSSGRAEITKGGIGKNNVALKLFCPENNGYKFDVEIRGMKIGEEHDAFENSKVGYFKHNML